MNNQESMLVIENRHTAFYLRQKSSTYEQLLNLKPYFESFLKDSFSKYGMEISNYVTDSNLLMFGKDERLDVWWNKVF